MNIQNFQFMQKYFDKSKVFRIASEGLQTNITVKNKNSKNQLLYLSRIIQEKGIFLFIIFKCNNRIFSY